MKKFLLILWVGFILTGFLLLGLINSTAEALKDCIYRKEFAGEEAFYLWGTVTNVQETEKAFITSLGLCNSKLSRFTGVKVHTSKESGLFDLGGPVTIRGKLGYQWQKTALADFKTAISPGQTFAVRVNGEITKEDKELLDSLKKRDSFRLALIFLKGKSIVSSSYFGKIESQSQFQDFTQGLLL